MNTTSNDIVKRLYDSRGNCTYRENSYGDWAKSEYDDHGNEIYREYSDGYWWKAEYDDHGKMTYCEDSHGEKSGISKSELEQEPSICDN